MREDLRIARDLVKLAFEADDPGDLYALVLSTRDWPDECLVAYLAAHERLREKDPGALREARLYLPKGEDVSAALLSRLEEAMLRESDLQPAEWPQPTLFPGPITTGEPVRFLANIPSGKNPFPHEQAEDEQRHLFGSETAAFWSGHDLWRRLAVTRTPTIVTGPPGCGRTALALALGRYLINREQFHLYLAGQPDMGEVQSGFAQLLLDFITTHPTLLSRLSTPERALVARFLSTVLGQAYVRAEVKAAQSQLSSARWLQPETGDDRIRKERWEELASHQLLLLEREISQSGITVVLEQGGWPRVLRSCVRSLGFTQLALVLDVVGKSATWANELILPVLRPWQANGLVVFLFLPEEAAHSIQANDGVTRCERLVWTAEQLAEMVRWRYRAFAGRRAAVEGLFSDGQFQALLDKSIVGSGQPNPRQWVRLWNRVIRVMKPDAELIGEEAITEATAVGPTV